MSARGRSGWDLVAKVGGSLGRRRAGTETALRALAAIARTRRVLVVPGGGRFADLVRHEMRRLGLAEARAHAMALRAMDQYAFVIAGTTPRARLVETFAAARRAAAAGRLPVLLATRVVEEGSGGAGARGVLSRRGRAPHGQARGGPVLERTFRTTSDAIAAWVAGRLEARHLVLLKSVPGIDLAIEGPHDAARAARRGLVDPRFARHLPRGSHVRIVDGRDADLAAALRRWLEAAAPHGAPPGRSSRAPGRAARAVRRSTARRAPR